MDQGNVALQNDLPAPEHVGHKARPGYKAVDRIAGDLIKAAHFFGPVLERVRDRSDYRGRLGSHRAIERIGHA